MQLLSGDAGVIDGPGDGPWQTSIPGSTKPDLCLTAPTRPEDLACHYDLTLSHPDVRSPQFDAFDRWLARSAAEFGLSCALVHDGIAKQVIGRLAAGQLTVGYHLDYFALWHRPNDPYARLAQAVEDAGGRSVNPPARARAFTDKAVAVSELMHHGFGVPATVILRPWSAPRPLTAAERGRLGLDLPGSCAYLKPANGFAGSGVVRVGGSDEALAAAIAAARQSEPEESLLLQREVQPPLLACEDGTARPAYWRVLFQMGEVFPFWWGPQERVGPGPSYVALTPAELRRHRLQAVLAYVRSLAELTGLDWFSTELCLGDVGDSSDFSVTDAAGRERPVLAIDPVNDQCDVDVQSRWPGAAPDDVVRQVAHRFAERAWQLRQRALRPHSAPAYRVAV
jgi:hypothetical protein